MVSDCLDQDWTIFSTFRHTDAENIAYVEYARMVAYRSKCILENVINKCDFDAPNGGESEEKGRKKALFLIKKAIDELNHGYRLINNETDDHIGFFDEKNKTVKKIEY
jgi:hypothetical protein